jgi:uncharacterized protein (TIGR02680 family)
MSDRRARWRASRAGIINVFEYGDQVFEFGGGRLLLRGPNGSGKSKAMELLFPFLFEGDMSAVKLDPFGKKARKMKWNLLMDGKYVHRIGYAWLELRHDDPRRTPQFVSFGVCLDAHKEWDEVKSRFFYVPQARVGIDFQLIGRDERPLSREQLRDLVTGLGGETFVQRNHYQERLNQVVFGYPSVKRLSQQIRLQRMLRRPQLSDSLDETLLNELLSEALPEIDSELLERSSKRLDQIEESRVRLETLKRNQRAVSDFSTSYASYARAELRGRRDLLREAAAALDEAKAAYDEHAAAAEKAQAELEAVVGELDEADAQRQRLRGTYETLLTSPEWQAANEIAKARARVTEANDWLRHAREQLTAAGDELACKQAALDQQEERVRDASTRFEAELERLDDLAEQAGMDGHVQLAGQFVGGAPLGPALEQLERAVHARRDGIAEVRRRRQKAEDRAQIADGLRLVCNEAREAADDARAARVSAEDELAEARGELASSIAAWTEGLREVELPAGLRDRLHEAADEAGPAELPPLAELVASRFAAAEAAYGRVELALDRRGEDIAAERAPLVAEQAELESAVDPRPQPLPTRVRRDPQRPGAPFWLLVDFADELDGQARAGLEGALEGAGLLDAWLLPDGSLLVGEDDVALVPAPLGNGSTLADLLRPAAGDLAVDAGVIVSVLRSIGLGCSEEQGFVVAIDGSFAFGPARGRHAKAQPQFIGHAARAANRARRLAEIAGERARLDELEGAVAGEREQLSGRRRQADAEQRSFPSERDVRLKHAALAAANLAAEAALREFERSERTAINAEREATLSLQDVEIAAGQHRLDPSGSEESLHTAAGQLDRYTDGLSGLREIDFNRRSALQMIDQLASDVADAGRRRDRQGEELERAETAVRSAEGELAGLETLSEGAERAIERADELKREIATCEQREKALVRRQNELTGVASRCQAEAEHAADAVRHAEAASAEALTKLRDYVKADLLKLALGELELEPQREQALAWDAAGWLSFFHGIKHEVLATRGGIDHLINTLDNDYQTLSQQVDARQLGISKERHEGLLLVRGFTHGIEQPLATLIDTLAEEVAESERRLSEEDRRLFEEFVTGGLADHLHRRINEAKDTIARMNEEIAQVQASSGMSIEVRWQRSGDGGPAQRRALELLQAAPSRLAPSEQAELQEFIRGQVRSARLESEENETTLAQLSKALDYRNWHTFKLRKANSVRGLESRDLTRHEHDTGSGGEKAISLHLPLLAAAASYPASGRPDALRMVMLDEAFTRIDEEGKRAIMGLIANFDLDIMLTSPDFWGCYAEVPELAIYALAPHDVRFPGVAARHFQWDGERRRAVDEPLLPSAHEQSRNGNGNGHVVLPKPLELFDGAADEEPGNE